MASMRFGSRFLTPGTKQIIAKSKIKRTIGVDFLLHSPVYLQVLLFLCIIRLTQLFAAEFLSKKGFLVAMHIQNVYRCHSNSQDP